MNATIRPNITARGVNITGDIAFNIGARPRAASAIATPYTPAATSAVAAQTTSPIHATGRW